MVKQTAAASPRFSTTLSPVSNPLISVRGLTKIYGQADTERAVTALDNVDVDFPRAQFTAIMGPSGSGKSSLLHILAGLDSFQSGTVKVAGRDLSQLNAAELTRFRRDKIGFIFQSFNLVPTLNVAENIELSAMVRRHSPDRRRLKALVKELDMESRLGAFPSELSGGQQQKVACARALLTAPEVVFDDEPTGNLDSASSAQVLSFLRAAARDWEQSVIMVTHEPDAAKYADRVLFLFDGQIVGQLENPTRETILEAEQNLGDVRQARKRAGQLGAAQSLRDVDPEALEKDLTAVMSLPKIEEETDSEQVESPAEEAAV
ncbi:ABC transporter ATP-binding protein [uncultured Mobiluncus sp.]|uniref:ABC transporter ATP-binding protein n=1 Tax=uncultured Mobiluncus sp. TaxID=293425 RepID=UPI00262AEB85|nr:ABC transporter ATP-binding protein [uncultured Mobiluncus sp.]